MDRYALPLRWVGLTVALAVLMQQAVAMLQGDRATFATSMWQVAVIALGLTSLALILMPRRRPAFFLGFLVCAGLMAWAFWLQYGEGLEPCPLCMFQRVAVIAIGLIFLVGTFHEPGRVGAWAYAFLLLLVSGIGAALAARQVWLQSLPKDEVPACGMGLSSMLETLPFKFTGAAESVYIFSKMGTEPWMRWTQGIWELLAAICLLTPRLRWAGAILATGAMGAAILSHLTWLGFSVQGDHGLLFCMALTAFTGSFTALILHRHSIPFITPLSYW